MGVCVCVKYLLQEFQLQLPAVMFSVKMAEHASQLVPRIFSVPVHVGIVACTVNFEYHLVNTSATGRQTMEATTTQKTAMKGA